VTHPPRLAFLIETVELETRHLLDTDGRLFAQGFDSDRAVRRVPLLVSLARAIAQHCRRRILLAQ